MKKFINHNFFWSKILVEQLALFGINNVCISPGSRNTPLNIAFAEDKRFKKYIIVDERSSGFFALGIAKKTGKPVVIITTSGTAVAELYPSIIEAFQSRIPLIICTADRPKYLRNSGANQTINQANIFKNHIRYSSDFELPSLSKSKLVSFTKKILEAYKISVKLNRGPVHLNFQFKKPLEPESFTDVIEYQLDDFISNQKIIVNSSYYKKDIDFAFAQIAKSKRTIVLLGWDNFSDSFYKNLLKFSELYKLPIFADITNQIRFFKKTNDYIISNHSSFLRSKNFCDILKPTLIIKFGNLPTSASVFNYFDNLSCKRILINEFGDRKDISNKKVKIIKINPNIFLDAAIKSQLNINQNKKWLDSINDAENKCELLKLKINNENTTSLEPTIPANILRLIPSNSNLFISNSLAIRDFDQFSSKRNINIKLYSNRGASGIDGIISTALGIASKSKNKTFLVIGDLAFYHNLTALSNIKELNIPLIIFLLNNNGGGIFNLLPISNNTLYFHKYFITPLNLDYSKIVKSFGGNYYSPKNWNTFTKTFNKILLSKDFSVIELKINSEKSLQLRNNYWDEIEKTF